MAELRCLFHTWEVQPAYSLDKVIQRYRCRVCTRWGYRTFSQLQNQYTHPIRSYAKIFGEPPAAWRTPGSGDAA